jgi:hypothetical protein
MIMADLSAEYADIILPDTMFITTVGILGVIGNIIVIILYCYKVKDENGDRYFIPWLAATDMLGSIFMTIYNALANYFSFNYPSQMGCKWLNFSLMVSGILSSNLLLIIAVQRYRKVCRPDSWEFTLQCRRLAVFFTVMISTIIMIPWLYLSGISSISTQFQGRLVSGEECKFIDINNAHRYHHLIFVYMGFIYTICLITLVVLMVLYALIALRLRQVFQLTMAEYEPLRGNRRQNYNAIPAGTNSGVQSRFNLMYGIIVIVYIVAFVPTAVLLFLTYNHVNFLNFPKHALVTWVIFSRFVVINHFVNPFIYLCFDVKFREALTQLFLCRKPTNSTELSVPS